jgi:hypothetical protein
MNKHSVILHVDNRKQKSTSNASQSSEGQNADNKKCKTPSNDADGRDTRIPLLPNNIDLD